MTQVWLVLVAFVSVYFGLNQQRSDNLEDVFLMIGLCSVTLSFILFFVNGGTTG